MALPSDYWRNPQMHNVFRTKPCQRLIRGGVCDWGSQCQFAHNLQWPRRPHRGHQYSPELCPHVKASGMAAHPGDARVDNPCPAGQKCPFAHSKEEVLYHPHLLKTCLCEEHASRQGASSRGRRKKHCHRHYCPFAHGAKELRASPLSADVRKWCLLAALNSFPSNSCCSVCDPQQVPGIPSQLVTVARCGRGHRAECRDLSFVVPDGAPQRVCNVVTGTSAATRPPWHAGLDASEAMQLARCSARGDQVLAYDAKSALQNCVSQGIRLPPGLDDEDFGPTRIGSTEEEEETDDSSAPTPPGELLEKDCPLLAVLQMSKTMDKNVSLFSTHEHVADPSPQMSDWREEEERLAEFLGL
eukprot:TRINITY_DN49615_c0_g1_i1.p1 TRINITY_DN49615_c0_g1~~TRINITY_DN49615_c0_g1_i1.p1  ORF type:complete len:357 (+),score=42.39 TRINITY_DN49615_c0_g1_i1:67-1137(+)